MSTSYRTKILSLCNFGVRTTILRKTEHDILIEMFSCLSLRSVKDIKEYCRKHFLSIAVYTITSHSKNSNSVLVQYPSTINKSALKEYTSTLSTWTFYDYSANPGIDTKDFDTLLDL